MKLIGNEVKYCEKHLRNNTIDTNPVKTVAIMVKYFFLIHEMTEEEVRDNINAYLTNVGVELEDELIDKLVKTNTSSKTTINQLESISITTTEWAYIQKTGRNERERKVLFTLLCMYKIKVGLGYANDGTVKVEYTKLNSDAHVTLTKAYRIEMLRYFTEVKAISIGMGQMAKKIKLNYVEDSGEVLLDITEYDCLHIYYEHLKKGGRLITCKECSDVINVPKKKQYNSVKFCKKCSNKRIEEQNRNRL